MPFLVRRATLASATGLFFDGRFLQEQVHGFRRQLGTLGFAVEAAQQVFRGRGVLGSPISSN
jgi:hypothetical protein